MLLEVIDVRKSFGSVSVLHGINLRVESGEVLALLGENGAGKSTLLNVIGGVIQPDSGSVVLSGDTKRWASPREAHAAGIAFVHQELSSIRTLSVAENVFLGDYHARRGFVDRASIDKETHRLLALVGASHIDPRTAMGRLGNADQQLVEIAKAQARKLKVLILDEPTSSLTPHEVHGLFAIIRRLKAEGVGIVFISHRFEEVFAIADRVVVLRDGKLVSDRPTASTTRASAIADMTGRAGFFEGKRRVSKLGKTVLRVQGLCEGRIGPLTFSVREGEVLGLFGLVGSGRTELIETLAGVRVASGGHAVLPDGGGLPVNPAAAWARGLAILPEDRKKTGIFPRSSVLENARSAARRRGPVWLSGAGERRAADPILRRLAVRTAGVGQAIERLSGGNQQKVVLARCLAVGPKLLLLDEPTRGIDIHTKVDLYRLIGELAASGMAVVFASSELPEILALATTVLVLAQGRQTLLHANDDLSEAEVLAAAFASPGDLPGSGWSTP